MNKTSQFFLAALTAMSLAACGGGGNEDDKDTGAGTASLPAPVDQAPGSTTPSPTPAPNDSFWSMDAYRYVNGGFSTAVVTPSLGGKFLAVAVVSTATMSGGDQSNGAYSGSVMSFSFLAPGVNTYAPGTYTIIPSGILSTLPGARSIELDVTVGANVNTGAVRYVAQQGQIEVTLGADGKPHFSSAGPITMTKSLEVLGGIPGAPATMTLNITNAH